MKTLLLWIAVLAISCASLPVSSLETLDHAAQSRLIELFRSYQLSNGKFPTIQAAHYSAAALNALKSSVKDIKSACQYLQSHLSSDSVLQSNAALFDLTSAANLLQCPTIVLSQSKIAQLKELISAASTPAADLHYAVATLIYTQNAIDNVAAVAKRIVASITDENLASYGHGFHALSLIASQVQDKSLLVSALDTFEDALQQSDETDFTLCMKNDLSLTSLVVRGAYALGDAISKAPPTQTAQLPKLARYFLDAIHTDSASAYHAVSALFTLAKNKFHVPLILSPVKTRIKLPSSSKMEVALTNVFGESTDATATVNLIRAEAAKAKQPVASNQALKTSANSNIYSFDFASLSKNPNPGLYLVDVSATLGTTSPKHFIAPVPIRFNAAIIASAIPSEFSIAVVDSASAASTKAVDVPYGTKYGNKVTADIKQKVIVRFRLASNDGSSDVIAHQAFVRVVPVSPHDSNQEEKVFIAEYNEVSKQYQAVVNVSAIPDVFSAASSDYDLSLLIGDAGLEFPIQWTFASVQVSVPSKFLQQYQAEQQKSSSKRLVGGTRADFSLKNEIHHVFKQSEQRPPAIISTIFTALVLLPALILFVAWGRLGANISNFKPSLSTLIFHVGFGGILAILAMFWLHWTFFTTLKYLAVVGVVTFLAGNKALSQL